MEIVHKESMDYQDGDCDGEASAFHPDIFKMFRYTICLNYLLRISVIIYVASQVTYQGATVVVGVVPMTDNSTSSTIGHVTTPRYYNRYAM